MYDRNPHNIDNLNINKVTNTSVNITWTYPDSGLNPIFEYSINDSDFRNIENYQINDDIYSYVISNLQPYNWYDLNLRA